MRTRLTRTGLTLGIVIALVGSLAACSSSSTDAAACTPTKTGKISEAVKVSGKFGALPKVTIADPVKTTKTQRTVVIKGKGKVAEKGDTVTVNFVLYNATSGKQVAGTTFEKGSTTTFDVDSKSYLAGIVKTLNCSATGSRVVSVIPPADTWGTAGATDLGVAATDSVVLVLDVVKVVTPAKAAAALPKATGTANKLPADFPAIKVSIAKDKTGTPTVTLPGGTAPTALTLATTITGTGKKVGEGDSVTVNYQGLNWDTSEIFDQSWGKTPATFVTTQVVEGFGKALVGQTVGSQVVVVIPPELAYGVKSDTNTSALAGQTLVFVIDILATVPAAK